MFRPEITPEVIASISKDKGDVTKAYYVTMIREPGPRHVYDALCALRSGQIGTCRPAACRSAAVRRSGKPTTFV